MSSPIHKYLFSPPPSPPRRPCDIERPSIGALSLILPTDLIPISPHLDGEIKARSPRTPRFTLDSTFPTYPTRLPEVKNEKAEPVNVPTAAIPMPTTLPRPFLRLLLLVSLLLSSVMMLIFVPTARLPSLRVASTSRRLALAPDGRAYLDVAHTVGSWSEAQDRDYRPPQIRAPHMMRRAFSEPSVPPHPKASRPAPAPRPLPKSHELLAVQSYLLESRYNVLPDSVDASYPIDANLVLGVGHHKLGAIGSTKETDWFSELEKENAEDVIIWHGGDGSPILPHKLIDMLTADQRKPTLMPCHHRTDNHLLHGVFDRLGLNLKEGPIIMLGNKPYSAAQIESLGREKVEELLTSIGWTKKSKPEWKPKLAVWKKREMTEVEHAIKKAKRN